MPKVHLKVLFVTEYMAAERHGPSRKAMLIRLENTKLKDSNLSLRFLTEDPPSPTTDCYSLSVANWQGKSRFNKYFKSLVYHRELCKTYHSWPFDAVCFNDAQQGIASAIFGLPGHSKLIAFINDDNSVLKERRSYDHFSRFLYRRLQRITERYVAQKAEEVICCSRYLAELIVKSYGLSSTPQVLRPALDHTEWNSTVVSRAKNTILFVKSEPRRGGLETLLKALHFNGLPSSIHHLHLGGFSKDQFDLEFKHLLPATVEYTIHGHLDRVQLRKLIATCHIGVVPSMFEAYGITAKEFLTGGLQTIVSDAGGLPEAVQGSDALIFQAGNAEDLSTVLTQALSLSVLPSKVSTDPYDSSIMYQCFQKIMESSLPE